MRHCHAMSLFISVSLTASRLVAQSVSEKDGGILFSDAHGSVVQLTKSGFDFAPSLSADGKLIVFVRHTPGETARVGWGDAEAREIWLIGVNGANAKRLVRGAEKVPWTDTLAQLDRPQFLSDSKRVVFDSALAAVDGTINIVDTQTGAIRRVGGGNSVEVIRTGPYRDHLIARQHRYYSGGGSYDYFWLLTLTNEVIGPIGPDEADVARFNEAFGATVESTLGVSFKWACDDLRGHVDDPLGSACDRMSAPATTAVE